MSQLDCIFVLLYSEVVYTILKHSSFEIVVETIGCKLGVVLRSRVLLGVSSLRIPVGDSPSKYRSVAYSRVSRVMLIRC